MSKTRQTTDGTKIRHKNVGASEAQIAANRTNARKSTGPRTAEGKAKVAQNAVKHDLFSQKKVVFSENQLEFDFLEGEMFAELAPVGVMETMLAERIVSLTWRLKRVERMQNELIDYKITRIIDIDSSDLSKSLITGEPQEKPGKYDDVVLGFVADRDFGGDRTLERLALYERRFELSLYKTMAQFKKLQKTRKAQDAKFKARAIPKASGFEDAICFEGVSPSNRGQACHEWSRRDARDTTEDLKKQFIPKGSQFQCTGAKVHKSQEQENALEKQTQFGDYEDEYELSDFEKKEPELLTSHV